MNIAAYVTEENEAKIAGFKNFIFKTFFSITQLYSDHTYIIITDKEPQYSFQNNAEIIVKPAPANLLLKKIWLEATLPSTLKKLKAELFISFENSLLPVSIPQIMVINDPEKARSAYLKKARTLIVNSEAVKKQLIDHQGLLEKNIRVIYPSANNNYKPIDTAQKERIKKTYSGDKEYFLYTGSIDKNEALIGLLKSFSHFKKRQQSSFKLLLLTNSDPSFEKAISDYKYRADVKFISGIDESDKANITAAAYAAILPFHKNEEQINALNAMQSAVPVIASNNSVITEIAGDGALYAEAGDIKDLGEKMMKIYTDENYRSQLINKGVDVSNKFSQEKSVELLWQAIIDALK